MLDRLVCWSVLTDGNAVVREDPDRPQVRKRRKSHGRAHVIAEHQERGAKGNNAAMCSDAVDRTAHCVLANPEMDVPSAVAEASAERALDVVLPERRRSEVA